MKRTLVLLYGLVAYVVFLASFLYAIAWVGDLPIVPRTIDHGPEASLGVALAVNCLLLIVFAIQHSGMARQGFKRWWTRFVPQPIERSTYVLISSLLLIVMYVLWRPIPAEVWSVENPVGEAFLWTLFAAGWLIVLLSSFMINHWNLFGLRQVWMHFKERDLSQIPFQVRFLYRFVRHPLLLGFVIAFWSIPQMTVGHLLFAVGTTGYMLVAIPLEERDLVRFHGEAYERYREKVPMLVPLPGKSERPQEPQAEPGSSNLEPMS